MFVFYALQSLFALFIPMNHHVDQAAIAPSPNVQKAGFRIQIYPYGGYYSYSPYCPGGYYYGPRGYGGCYYWGRPYGGYYYGRPYGHRRYYRYHGKRHRGRRRHHRRR